MRRLILLTVAGHLTTLVGAQVWEKPVAPGLSYRMELDWSGPRMIHALRWTPSATATVAKPELGNATVYAETVADSRKTISEMVSRSGAVAGINADFFPFTGDPLGLMVRDRTPISRPHPTRAVFCWGPASASVGVAEWRAALVAGNERLPIDGLNEECAGSMVVLNTPDAGFARAKGESVFVVLRLADARLAPNHAVQVEVESVLADAPPMPVRTGQAVLVATGSRRAAMRQWASNAKLRLEILIDGFDWTRHEQAVGGGPFLVRNGRLAVDADRQGFNEAFAQRRHPRTAVGRTASGEVWFVAVDGRQPMSVGATLEEMAHLMRKFACVDAINLDGGGSTTLHILGATVNRPSDGPERPVANGVLFFAEKPKGESATPQLEAPEKLAVGDLKTLRVRVGRQLLGAHEVVWSAQGAGWIDQGGLLRASAPGITTVRAVARGRMLQKSIQIAPTALSGARKR